MPSNRPLIGKVVVLTVLAISIAGIVAAWQLQHSPILHPGVEAFRRFAPQNATLVVTLDLKPNTFEQGQVMQRLNASLKSEGLSDRISNTFQKLTKEVPFLYDIGKELTGNGTAIFWGSDTNTPAQKPTLLLVLDTANKSNVESLLKRNAKVSRTVNGQPLYIVPLSPQRNDSSPDAFCTMRDNYLLIADSETTLVQADITSQNRNTSLSQQSDYQSLRKTLPAEANLVCYASANALREAQKQANQNDKTTAALLTKAQSACFSITLRQGGIAVDSTMGGNADFLQPIIETASIQPSEALRVPPKALGMFVVAQPGKYLEAFDQAMQTTDSDTRQLWDKNLADIEQQSHIRLHEDVIPALLGHLTVAFYPGVERNTMDILLMTDSTHNANPGELVEQMRVFIENQDHKLNFRSQKQSNVTLWTLPSQWNISSIGNTSPQPSRQPLIAHVGNTVLMATSNDLLKRAVSSYQQKQKPALEFLRLPSDSKSLVVVQPTEILDILKPHIEEMQQNRTSNPIIQTSDLYNLFGTSPFIASVGYRDHYFTGSLLLPFHYETACRLSRQIWDEADKSQN